MRFPASASALSKIAERLFNVWKEAGTDAWYIESDFDGDILWWEMEDNAQKELVGNCVRVKTGLLA